MAQCSKLTRLEQVTHWTGRDELASVHCPYSDFVPTVTLFLQ